MPSNYSDLGFSNNEQKIVNELLGANPYNKEFISDKLELIFGAKGLASALITIFWQQVQSGFVLSDPTSDKRKESKYFLDKQTGINFYLQWNPNRELRLNHDLLIQRGVIDTDIEQEFLINRDGKGNPCYLCSKNIDIQNPIEILLPIELAGIKYYCGANFAPITNNHFTIMSEEHKPQNYDSDVTCSMIDFAEKTNGVFKAIFNDRAGASILSHLHLQGTTEKLPIEDINISTHDLVFSDSETKVYKPNYYLPLFILESESARSINKKTDRIIENWRSLNPDFYTQNIIVLKHNKKFKVFVFLRDSRKLSGSGKQGDMGTFECSGLLVFSKGKVDANNHSTEERGVFENSSLDTIKNILNEIAPEEKKPVSDLI
jgi:hypothetical protein